MKKIYRLTAILFIAGATSCGSNNTAENNIPAAASSDNTAKTTTPANAPEGVALMSNSDCNACHTGEQKVVGPSFKDIAAKYPNTPENIAKLTDEVIKGSSGVWGQVPMTPHANTPRADIEKMVAYILSVK